ncbi:hypothetical protein ACOMHN_043041 [Nucella lapillus]
MTDGEKTIALILISCLTYAVSGGYKCHDGDLTSPSTEGYTTWQGGGGDRYDCCKVEHLADSITVTHFGCRTGCCGERDDEFCCKSTGRKDDLPSVIGGALAGVLIFLVIVVLLVCAYRRYRRRDCKFSDHKKLLKEVYAAERLDELLVPAHTLVSGPGTIVHPMTNFNGPFLTADTPAYVMPDLDQDQPQVLVQTSPPPSPPPPPPTERIINDEDNEENWDRWDGFPSSEGINSAAGRGRDNPHYQGGEGEDGLPYYYEQYDRYAQPPPGYEEVTQEATEEVTSEVVTDE